MRYLCTICQENHALTTFRFLLCGHGFCSDCIQTVLFHFPDAHPVFIDSSESSSQLQPTHHEDEGRQPPFSRTLLTQMQHAATEITNMDSQCSVESVQKAAREIQNVAEGLDGHAADLKALMHAITKFWRNMAPLFTTISGQKLELASLGTALRGAQGERARAVADTEKAQRLAKEAIDTAEKAGEQTMAMRDENRRLVHKMEGDAKHLNEQLASQKDEIQDLKNTLLAHKAKEAKQRTKITDLREQVRQKEADIDRLRRTSTFGRSAGHNIPSSSLRVYSSSQRREPPELEQDGSLTLDSDSELELENIVPAPAPRASSPAVLPMLPESLQEPLPQGRSHMFPGDWDARALGGVKRKRVSIDRNPGTTTFPLALDSKGRLKGTAQLGSRHKINGRFS
ncbi:hypothetical protein A0H81_06275 [Grifola frondosa]|uniref:Zinc finger C3HC4 RING-type domain-containing protein n=1 Tax=Grifola frondosa TaxID=5627 RepID=A0A1C7MBB7_GRIFR|nr:hypothetical protein A0H81_06275 [Grifola frondosa]